MIEYKNMMYRNTVNGKKLKCMLIANLITQRVYELHGNLLTDKNIMYRNYAIFIH